MKIIKSFKAALPKIADAIDGKHTGAVITTKKSITIIASMLTVILIYALIFFGVEMKNRTFEVETTACGTPMEISMNLSVTPEKILYSPQQKQIEYYITVDDLYTGYTTTFDLNAYLRAEKVEKLNAKCVAKNDDVMIVRVSDIPKNFQAVRLDISPVTDTKEDITPAKIYCTTESCTTVSELKATTEKEYLTVYYNFKIDEINSKVSDTEKRINELKKQIEINNEVIKKIDEKIPLLEETEAAPARSQRQQKEQQNKNILKEIENEKKTLLVLENKRVSLKKRFANL